MEISENSVNAFAEATRMYLYPKNIVNGVTIKIGSNKNVKNSEIKLNSTDAVAYRLLHKNIPTKTMHAMKIMTGLRIIMILINKKIKI